MKKNLIPILLSLIFITAFPVQAVKTINVNPVNLAVAIVEKTDSVKIAKEFEYYGYTVQNTEDGYNIMKASNGNEIRYTFKDSNSSDKFPSVIVKLKENPSELDARLKDLRFKKEGNAYKRITSRGDHHFIQCTFGPTNTLILKCLKR